MRYVRIKFCDSQKYSDLGQVVRKNVQISKDLSPEGRWTYLDEGVFRLIHRNEVDPKSVPNEPLGPAHSYLRAAKPLTHIVRSTVKGFLFTTLPWVGLSIPTGLPRRLDPCRPTLESHAENVLKKIEGGPGQQPG
jgi:hypothetical protein